jgi:hypothetical protein
LAKFVQKVMFKLWGFGEFLYFLVGFAISTFTTLNLIGSDTFKPKIKMPAMQRSIQEISMNDLQHADGIQPPSVLYEQKMADKLFNDVRILCWVFTHPDPNHKSRVPYVRATWGKRCNKLLFMSTQTEPGFDDIVALPVEDGRGHLWNKTRMAMKYVYDNHLNDADWFIRADDDK